MSISLPKCEFCGGEFIPRTSWQKTCQKPECEKKRIAANQAAYYRRKKGIDTLKEKV